MTHKNVAHDAYYICTTCGSQCQLAGFSIFAEKIWSNRKKMKRDTIDICTVTFLYSGNVNTCCREGALEGRNHFGIRRKKVKAVTVISSSESQSTLLKNFTMVVKKVIRRRVNPSIPILIMISQVGVLL